jgi:TatA/E family protein of Tat protein translocase
MFGIGMPEMILILAVALIVIGPKKLPDLAKSLGQALGEFKKATRELKDAIEIESEIDSVKESYVDIKHHLSTDDENEISNDSKDKPIPSPELPASSENETGNHNNLTQKGQEGLKNNDRG